MYFLNRALKVGDCGELIDVASPPMQKLHTLQGKCGVLHSRAYTRSRKRIDYAIQFQGSTGASHFGLIEFFEFLATEKK